MAIIKITNDGKGKSQSFEAELIVPRVDKIISSGEWVDDLNVCSLIQYGATEQEALEALGNNLNYIVEEILKIQKDFQNNFIPIELDNNFLEGI